MNLASANPTSAAVLALAFIAGCGAHAAVPPTTTAASRHAYANVHGLSMYYEVHGAGRPLVLLHGGVSTIDNSFGQVIPVFARTHTVIAIEQQGHGHTADIDRPLSYEQMAEDTNALLGQLGVTSADFLGWSDGGLVALRVAMKHPERVRRVVLLSSGYDNENQDVGAIKEMTPEMVPPGFHDAYSKVAPDPSHWPAFIQKTKGLALNFKGWSADEVRAVEAPALVMLGDHDIYTTEYALRMSRLLLHAQLAVLPGSDHFAIHRHPDWIVAMAGAFLDSP